MTAAGARLARLATVPVFFAVKIASALVLLAASTAWLPVAGFAEFTQLLILAALLNLIAIGGAHNGVIRMAAATNDSASIARTRNAALLVWLVFVAVALVLALPLRGAISTVLVGDGRAAAGVAGVVLLTLAAGPGQIFTSILTGRRRPAASLTAQGLGLGAGTVAALALLREGDPQGAATAFAAGPVLTMAVAWLLLRSERLPRLPFGGLACEIRQLLSYGGATVLLAAFSALVLFGLRYAYQEAFGLDALGRWLAANRISDTTTQFLGLVIVQLFLPRYAALEDPSAARRLVLQTWAAGVAVMGGVLVVFAARPELLVTLFLSPAYLPAITGILLYMIGDTLRVWAAVAMNVQLASRRPWAYAGIEIATMAFMAAITLAGIAAHQPLAPMIGYLAAYGLTALAVTVWFVRARLGVTRPAAPPGTGGGEIAL